MHWRSRRRPMPPSEPARLPASSLSRWFAEEVQPHEPALRAYLQARFPTLGDYDDIVQESYVRLLKAQAAGQVQSREEALEFVRADPDFLKYNEEHKP